LEDDTQKLQMLRAEARLSKAQRDYKRTKDLFEKEFVAQDELNTIIYELKQAEVQFAEAEQEISYTKITAPIRGTITNRIVKFGDFINNGQELFEIVDFDSIVALVYLPEKKLVNLEEGQVARFTSQALGEERFGGSVKRIAPVVDSRTGTVKVTVNVDDTSRLLPGMYVDVAIIIEVRPDALLVPKRGLVYDNDQIFAFRVVRHEDQVLAERVLVTPAMSDETWVMPQSGFREGDEIVIAGQTGLKDQAEVRVLTGAAEHKSEPAPDSESATDGEVALHD